MMYASWAGARFTTASGVILQAVVPDMNVSSSVIPSAVEESFCAASIITKSSSSVNASTDDGSGIPTFRDAGGLWRKHDVRALATPQAWGENQSRVWQFYHYRREIALKACPNAAQTAIAQLAIPALREKVAPNAEVTHITQNIDGLSTRAYNDLLPETEQRSTPFLFEMHGRLGVECTAHDCKHRESITTSPICPGLAGTETLVEAGTERVVRRADLPRCSQCGELARPGVVWFGEKPHRIQEIMALAERADFCIVVGTSSIIRIVKKNGGKVAVFNVDRTNHDDEADFLFLDPCEISLPQVLNISM
ncbi:DHS-like NAD/FAD-binding domain-containing protein [Mucidula mucida]|nr:DHS-like NAD/FAD-binding domain-containing protein [Mucidula mucida]